MISILIPAYNEAASINTTISAVRGVFDQLDLEYEIIVTDDGSTDQTGEFARATGVTVLRHPTNHGYGAALKTALMEAQYDWCAIVDADGSYPIESFPGLLEYIPDFDMVVAARTGKHYWGPLGKRVGRFFLGKMVEFVTGSSIPDVNSGMRIFRRDFARQHIKRISSGFSFTTTLTLAMLMEEQFVKYVPIEYHPRVGKSKVNIIPDTLRVIQILAHTIIYYNPLKLFLLLCIAVVVVGLFIFVLDFFIRMTPGAWFLSGAILLGILLGGMGFLSEALRQLRLVKE